MSFSEIATSPNSIVYELVDHTLPLIYIFVDWCLNAINFEWSHIYLNCLIIVVYGIVNATFVMKTGKEVYPMLTWDSWLAWLLAGAVLIIVIVLQLLTIWCTKIKIKRIIARQ